MARCTKSSISSQNAVKTYLLRIFLTNFHIFKEKGRRLHITLKSSLNILNFLPTDKILDWSKLEAFADDKLNDAEI